jgi:hypothetical protein
MKTLNITGYIIDEQLVNQLGKAGILLCYYINQHNFYQVNGVFYKTRPAITKATTISINAQLDYEQQLIKLGLLSVFTIKGDKANRFKLDINAIKTFIDTHSKSNDIHSKSNDAHSKSNDTHSKSNDAHSKSNMSQSNPIEDTIKYPIDVPMDDVDKAFAEIKLLNKTK